jgi:hypothetical protein
MTPTEQKTKMLRGIKGSPTARWLIGDVALIGRGTNIHAPEGINKVATVILYPEKATKTDVQQAAGRISGLRFGGLERNFYMFTEAKSLENDSFFAGYKPKEGWASRKGLVAFEQAMVGAQARIESQRVAQGGFAAAAEHQISPNEFAAKEGGNKAPPFSGQKISELKEYLTKNNVSPLQQTQIIEALASRGYVDSENNLTISGQRVIEHASLIITGTDEQKQAFSTAVQKTSLDSLPAIPQGSNGSQDMAWLINSSLALSDAGVVNLDDGFTTLSSYIQFGKTISPYAQSVQSFDPQELKTVFSPEAEPFTVTQTVIAHLPEDIASQMQETIDPVLSAYQEKQTASMKLNGFSRGKKDLEQNKDFIKAYTKYVQSDEAYRNSMASLQSVDSIAKSLGVDTSSIVPLFMPNLMSTENHGEIAVGMML